MKITIIGGYPTPQNPNFTGPTRVTYNLANELAKIPENDVWLFTAHRHRHFYKKDVCLQETPLHAYQITRQSLMMKLLRQSSDIFILSGVSEFNTLGLFFKKIKGKSKIIYIAHGSGSWGKKEGFEESHSIIPHEQILLKKSDYIITVSEAVKNMFIQYDGISSSKISVIYNGVEDNFFSLADPYPFMNAFHLFNKNILLFIGEVRKIKGLDFLLHSLRNLDGKNWVMVLAGPETPYIDWLKTEFKDLFLAKKVKYIGRLNDEMLLSAYAAAKIFILPSRFDSYSLVTLEAMAAGKPVIISDRVGAKAIIKDGREGFIVPFGDTDALSSKISYLLSNENKCEKMGLLARKKALENKWEKIAKEYLSLFKEFVSD